MVKHLAVAAKHRYAHLAPRAHPQSLLVVEHEGAHVLLAHLLEQFGRVMGVGSLVYTVDVGSPEIALSVGHTLPQVLADVSLEVHEFLLSLLRNVAEGICSEVKLEYAVVCVAQYVSVVSQLYLSYAVVFHAGTVARLHLHPVEVVAVKAVEAVPCREPHKPATVLHCTVNAAA